MAFIITIIRLKNKIKNYFKELFNLKHRCKYCKYYGKYIKAFDGERQFSDREPDNGKNICLLSFNFYINEVGEDLLKTYGKDSKCEHCGQIIYENKSIRYDKCLKKNWKLKCKDFHAKFYYKLFME